MPTGGSLADLEMGGGVVRALRMARSDAAEAAYAADAVPIPLLRGLEPELEVLPEAVFGQGCAAFAVDDRILAEPGWDGDLVRVTGHCGATLVVLSDDARTMERSVGGLPLPLDGGRVVLAPSGAAGMRAALATALRSGEPGSGIAVAASARLLFAVPTAAAEWWATLRSSGALCGAWWDDQGGGVAWSGLFLQCGVDPVEDRLVQSQVEVVGALAGDDGGRVVLEESHFGFGEPSDHGVRRGVYVDRLAQVGVVEPFRVAVVKGRAGNAQLDRLPVGGRPPVGQLRGYGIRKVVEHPRQGSVDEVRRHVQASGHQQITVSAIRAVQRQVARHQERPVGISHHDDMLVLRLEVIDHAAQEFHAHVDLRLQVRKGQSRMPRGQAGIERERLVHLHEMNVLVAAVSQKGKEHLVGDLVRRPALLEDPHRVGVWIRHHLLYLEQLGDIVRQLRCPVAGIGNEGPAADCEHPGRERRDQTQPQIEPRPTCDKLDAGKRMHGLTATIDGALAVLQSGSLRSRRRIIRGESDREWWAYKWRRWVARCIRDLRCMPTGGSWPTWRWTAG